MNKHKIAVIGLGYVGLPLAVEFAKKYSVVGFDINSRRIDELIRGKDHTFEIEESILLSVLKRSNIENSDGLYVTTLVDDLEDCDIYIVTVPTPTDKYNHPVLTPMIEASKTVANVLKPGDIVVYESTVYPGVTEDECVPVLAQISNLVYNKDFFVGYSPERINPGDKVHTVSKILKITSGSTPDAAETIDQLYKSIITAGTYKAPTIKVAEAAKVIENSQRDINIAFVNELSKIFTLLGIDTYEVLKAASTKWNFLNFTPGLVGGHCTGVDPYYLAQKAQEVGYHPEIILAGRRMNDSMGQYIANELIKQMLRKNLNIIGSNVLLLGFTFKENCPDIRNTRVIDIYNQLKDFDINIDLYDPWADAEEVKHTHDIEMMTKSPLNNLDIYSAIILAVAHDEFKNIKVKKTEHTVIFDVKGILPPEWVDARL
jgi:UDP-N-acetyl-D-galactosamine dehydrogenase